MRPHCRHFLAAAAALGIALIPACSSGAEGSAAVPDPSSPAQATARLLAPGKTQGFLVTRANLPSKPGKAAPFVPPHGSLDHACSSFIVPILFIPNSTLDVGESLSLPIREQRRYLPAPPQWMEWIDVYPGTEAAGIVKALPALIGKCGHFTFSGPGNSAEIPARESAVPLSGYGDQALYVSIRLLPRVPNNYSADAWMVIRSDRTLIFIDGDYVRPAGNAPDRMTLQLAREAWQRYSAT